MKSIRRIISMLLSIAVVVIMMAMPFNTVMAATGAKLGGVNATAANVATNRSTGQITPVFTAMKAISTTGVVLNNEVNYSAFYKTYSNSEFSDALTSAPVAGTTYYGYIEIDNPEGSINISAGLVNISITGYNIKYITSIEGSTADTVRICYSAVKPLPSHTVTFYTDNQTVYDTQTVADGDYASMPADPYKEGHVFNCWYTENGEEFDFYETPITEDIELFALFTEDEEDVEPTEYMVVFTVIDEVYDIKNVKEGDYVTPPSLDPTLNGHIFNWWCTENGEEFDFYETPITEDIELFALFTEEEPDDGIEAPVVSISAVYSSGANKLTWEGVAGAQYYDVYYSETEFGTYDFLASPITTSYTHSEGLSGQKYYYYVVAVDYDANESDKSNIVSRTCDLPRPVVKASNDAATGKIKLSWEAVEGAVEYEIYRSTSKDGTYKKIYTTEKTTMTNKSTNAGTTYYYKVKAVHTKSAATSAYSTVVYKMCDLPRPVVKASNDAATGKIKLSWEAVEGAVEYEIYRSTSKDGTYKKIYTTEKTTMTNKSTNAGTTYYYKVKAVHAKSSATSAYSTVVYKMCDLPRPVVSISRNSAGNPKLQWEEVEGAVEYEIYRSTSQDGTYKKIYTTEKTTMTNKSVTEGVTYYYKVKAVHAKSSATSAYSAVKYITAK